MLIDRLASAHTRTKHFQVKSEKNNTHLYISISRYEHKLLYAINVRTM